MGRSTEYYRTHPEARKKKAKKRQGDKCQTGTESQTPRAWS